MRMLIVVLVALLAWSSPAVAKVKVVTTLADLASITEAVGGERVEVESLINGRMDPHYVEVLPSYMLKVKKADLLVRVGMDLEIWINGVIDGARNPKLTVLDCSQRIEILQRPTGRVNPSMGDIHVAGNPHYWLDPRNGKLIAEDVTEALIGLDPDGAGYYRERLAAFLAAIDEKLEAWRVLMEPVAGSEIIYFHNSWPYFNRAFGVTAAGFVEPKPGVDPSPGHTAAIIDLIKSHEIRVIAMAPYFNPRVPESIARETGATLVFLADSVGGVDGADDYLSLFDVNLQRLLDALGAAR
jgi:zinc/manganese transport system substrate-binding protein